MTDMDSRFGWVLIGVYVWPFAEYREITKGRYKGLYEVVVNGNKYIVAAERIRSFPSLSGDKPAESALENVCV